VPANPQYPLRGADGGGSLVSHRHGVLFGYEHATFSK